MAKFFGNVGYGVAEETSPGVWEDLIVEKEYYGEVLRNTRKLDASDQANANITVSNSISIVVDTFANENIFAMKYVEWLGTKWIISDVEVDELRPRLLLRLGGKYNGPTP